MLMPVAQVARSRPAQLSENPKQVCVVNQTRNRTVAAQVAVADTPGKRRRGLLGTPGLRSDHGLWILPCESVHTLGMRYSIDLIYLNKRHQVVKTVAALVPFRVSLCLRARSVLELPSGTIDQSGTRPGDQLSFTSSLH